MSYSSMSGDQLIRACANPSDAAAWTEFVQRYQRPISLAIIRTADQWGKVSGELLDDLVQETYLKLCTDKCRLLLEFATRHPEAVIGYIKTVAVNLARDHFKAVHTQKRGSGRVTQPLEDAEPEIVTKRVEGPEAMEQAVLFDQISQCIEGCAGPDKDRDSSIFWLYYQQGLSAKDIAALPTMGLTAKGVESVIFRLTSMIREKIVGIRQNHAAQPAPEQKGYHSAESL